MMIILKRIPFMQHERYVDISIYIVVFLVHAVVLLMILDKSAPQLNIEMPAVQLVSLGDFNTGKADLSTKLDSITSYEPEQESQIKPSDKILTIKSEEHGDIIEKPKPIEKLKPIEKPTSNKKNKNMNKIEQQTTTSLSDHKGEVTHEKNTSTGEPLVENGGGEIMATHLGRTLNNPPPPYPPLSIENRETGSVRLQVVVETDGRPSLVKLIKSSGYPRLDRSALKTVKEQYRFKPASRLGVPIKSNYTFTITFELH